MNSKSFVLVAFTISLLTISCTSNKEKAMKLIQQGIEDNNYKRYEDAFQKFEKAISLKDDIPDAYYYRGNYFYNIEKYNNAMSDYNKALLLDSNYADAYYNRGLIKNMNRDKKGCCEDWLKAEKLGKPDMEDKTRWCK